MGPQGASGWKMSARGMSPLCASPHSLSASPSSPASFRTLHLSTTSWSGLHIHNAKTPARTRNHTTKTKRRERREMPWIGKRKTPDSHATDSPPCDRLPPLSHRQRLFARFLLRPVRGVYPPPSPNQRDCPAALCTACRCALGSASADRRTPPALLMAAPSSGKSPTGRRTTRRMTRGQAASGETRAVRPQTATARRGKRSAETVKSW